MFRSFVIAATSASLAIALPQDINLKAYEGAPNPDISGPSALGGNQPPFYDATLAAQSAAAAITTSPIKPDTKRSFVARAECDPQPLGSGPIPSPDTYDEFMGFSFYSEMAQGAPPPAGYVMTFLDFASSTEGSGCVGYYVLNSYDAARCGSYCDATQGCTGFNVYVERDPTVEPGPDCQDPPSTINFNCSLWSIPVTAVGATYQGGQIESGFQSGIRGSNGYNKLVTSTQVKGFAGPIKLAGAIQAPDDSYMGMRFFDGPYDPTVCGAVCSEITTYNSGHPRVDSTYDTCAFFNSYILTVKGEPHGLYCSFYTKAWNSTYASNVGQYRGSDYFSVDQSNGYSLGGSN